MADKGCTIILLFLLFIGFILGFSGFAQGFLGTKRILCVQVVCQHAVQNNHGSWDAVVTARCHTTSAESFDFDLSTIESVSAPNAENAMNECIVAFQDEHGFWIPTGQSDAATTAYIVCGFLLMLGVVVGWNALILVPYCRPHHRVMYRGIQERL